MKKILMGSIVLTAFAISMTIFQISSCKKANAQTATTFPIQGLWTGTYITDGQSSLGPQYYSFAIKPDGTIITDTKLSNQQYVALGNWSLTGNVLTTSYTYINGGSSGIATTQSTTATWDNSGKLTGSWKNVSPNNGSSGTFTLSRIN